MNDIFKKIREELKYLECDSIHDIYHLERTFNLAMGIAEKEGGDELVIGSAAFLHDYCIPPYETHTNKESLERIKQVLLKINFPEIKIRSVLDCIEIHEDYSFSKKNRKGQLEAQILQDADRLDATGAIGIMRTVMFGGAQIQKMHDPNKRIEDKPYEISYIPNTVIEHFYQKLLKLKDEMHTATARSIAEGRHRYMEQFLNRFYKEWDGEL